MGQCAGQSQALLLPAGQAHAAIAHAGIQAVRHGFYFILQADSPQVLPGVVISAQQDVVADAVAQQLGVMPQVANHAAALRVRHAGHLTPAVLDGTGIGQLTQKRFAQCGFAASHRAGNAKDPARLRGKGDILQNRCPAPVGKAKLVHGQGFRLGRDLFRQGVRLAHQRFDASPGYLGFLHRVEQLCRVGGFDRQFAKAGQERGERCNIPGGPAVARHIARAKGKDEQHAGHRDDPVQRRHGGHRQPGLDGGVFVIL